MSKLTTEQIMKHVSQVYKASLEQDTRPQIHLTPEQIQDLHDQGKLHHYTKGSCLIVTSIQGADLLEQLLEDQ